MQQLPIDFETRAQENISVNALFLKTIPYNSAEIKKVISGTHIGQSLKEDTLGILFEKIINVAERKNLGQFYTPKDVVDYIVKFLNLKYDSKILDPTCGCGVFLTTAYKSLRIINKEAVKNIYGVDLNKTATELTRINLWLKEGMQEESLRILERNIKVGNSIIDDKSLDIKALVWDEEFKDVLTSGGFDFIIGNPPYLTLKKGLDYKINYHHFSQIENGPVNAASLVIMRSWQLLKIGGIMAFVLPKTLLRVNSYSKLRKFLLENCKILHLVDLGNYFMDVRGEQVLLFLKKISQTDTIDDNPVLIKILSNKNKTISQQKEFHIKQGLFKKYNNFLLFEDQKYYSLIDKVNKIGLSLGKLTEIFRGLTLSPSSSFVSQKPSKESEPIIKGSNIAKFSFKIKYFVESKRLNGGPKLSKLNSEKIILQNIFSTESGVISAFDTKGHITFDTVTNIVLKTNKITYRYLLALLNSKLMNFYLIFALFNRSKLTMHTDSIYLEKLPIVVADAEMQEKLRNLVKILEISKNKILMREIDKLVFSIYGISDYEQRIIDDSLRGIMSSKSFW